MIFGLSAIPLISIAGLGIDYGRITEAQSSLQQVADGAVLAASVAKGSNAQRKAVAEACQLQLLSISMSSDHKKLDTPTPSPITDVQWRNLFFWTPPLSSLMQVNTIDRHYSSPNTL
jgi:Flp pilus assembly protein TadG